MAILPRLVLSHFHKLHPPRWPTRGLLHYDFSCPGRLVLNTHLFLPRLDLGRELPLSHLDRDFLLGLLI